MPHSTQVQLGVLFGDDALFPRLFGAPFFPCRCLNGAHVLAFRSFSLSTIRGTAIAGLRARVLVCCVRVRLCVLECVFVRA